MNKPLRTRFTRLLMLVFAAVVSAFALLAAALFFYQRRMIYFPRPYEQTYKFGLPERLVEVGYETRDGHQVAFYLPPGAQPGQPPRRLWVMFHGNAATALDWLDIVEKIETPGVGFLLVDYPDYGLCQGNPTRTG
ncbi:hypothetical protein HZA57_02265, partial [Candidatus Poribacteria bacterium]|nr:hypothetical protein [Candidatus Poribacteria bacterium]